MKSLIPGAEGKDRKNAAMRVTGGSGKVPESEKASQREGEISPEETTGSERNPRLDAVVEPDADSPAELVEPEKNAAVRSADPREPEQVAAARPTSQPQEPTARDDPLTFSEIRREAERRLIVFTLAGLALVAAFIFDFERELAKACLIWGSFMLILYASLSLHPRLGRLWSIRFEAFGIVLVAWGTFILSGLPSGTWAMITMSGAWLLMILLSYIHLQDAKKQLREQEGR
jgi:hypothetical protein